jgi:hypothetical protein
MMWHHLALLGGGEHAGLALHRRELVRNDVLHRSLGVRVEVARALDLAADTALEVLILGLFVE